MDAVTVGYVALALCAVGLVAVAIVLVVVIRRQWRVNAAIEAAGRLMAEESYLLALRLLSEAQREHDPFPGGHHTETAEAVAIEMSIVGKAGECLAHLEANMKRPESVELMDELNALRSLFADANNFLIDGRSMVRDAATEFVEGYERAYVLRTRYQDQIAAILATKAQS